MTSYSSKLLQDKAYGIYINNELVATTTSYERFKVIMDGLKARTEKSQKFRKITKIA